MKLPHKLPARLSIAVLGMVLSLSACGPAPTPAPATTAAPLALPATWTPSPVASPVPTFTQIPTSTPVPFISPPAYPTHDAYGALLGQFQDTLYPPRGHWGAFREPEGIRLVDAQTKKEWALPCELFRECDILLPIRWSRNGQLLYFAPAVRDSGAPAGIHLFTALGVIEVRKGKWERLLPDSSRYYDFAFSPKEDYLAYTQSSTDAADEPTVTLGILRLKNLKGEEHDLDGVHAGNIIWSPFRQRVVFQIRDPEAGSSVVFFDLENGNLKYVLQGERSDLLLTGWDQDNLVALQMKDWTTRRTSYWLLNPFTGAMRAAPRP